MVEESVANLFISQDGMGSVICSLIFKELVSILVLSNYKRNQCFVKFCHWFVNYLGVHIQLSVATQFYIIF